MFVFSACLLNSCSLWVYGFIKFEVSGHNFFSLEFLLVDSLLYIGYFLLTVSNLLILWCVNLLIHPLYKISRAMTLKVLFEICSSETKDL